MLSLFQKSAELGDNFGENLAEFQQNAGDKTWHMVQFMVVCCAPPPKMDTFAFKKMHNFGGNFAMKLRCE